MSIIDQLRKVVVTDELDLSELDGAYVDDDSNPIKLPFRINWTRSLKQQRRELRKEHSAIQQALRDIAGDEGEERIEELNQRAEKVAEGWIGWWADVLMMDAGDVDELIAAIPGGHWDWITGRIVRRVLEYEMDAVKKASAAPSSTSEAQEADHQKSSSEQS